MNKTMQELFLTDPVFKLVYQNRMVPSVKCSTEIKWNKNRRTTSIHTLSNIIVFLSEQVQYYGLTGSQTEIQVFLLKIVLKSCNATIYAGRMF